MSRSCPNSGRKLHRGGARRHDRAVAVEEALVQHVVESAGLEPAAARRLVEDVVAFYAEPVEDYVRRRHTRLKTYGARNDAIFAQLAEEVAGRVFAAPPLTERQLRRIIYG